MEPIYSEEKSQGKAVSGIKLCRWPQIFGVQLPHFTGEEADLEQTCDMSEGTQIIRAVTGTRASNFQDKEGKSPI